MDINKFPKNELGLRNFTYLKSNEDQFWAGIKKEQVFSIIWDGAYVRADGLTWSVERIIDEIKLGYWTIVNK